MRSVIPNISGLKKILNRFNNNGTYAKSNEWSIAKGGYDLDYEIYYRGLPIIRCIGGDIEIVSSALEPEAIEEIVNLVSSIYGDKLQERFMNLNEKKYNMAEVLMYFKDSVDRDKAFDILLDHNEDVYKCDEHYSPSFPGSDRKKATQRAIVIYADIFEDINDEVPAFVEDMQSLLPVEIEEYVFNPVGENIEESTSCGEGKIEESKVGDVDIICNEVLESNKEASPEDIADKIVSVMGISKESALGFAEDFLKSKVLNESREKDISIDFPIPVNNVGRIKANDAKKLLKTLHKMGVLRVGRTYFIKDSAGNETCWDLTKDTFDSFVFACEITEVDGEEVDFYNALTFSKGRNGLTDFEWEAHRVESVKNPCSRLSESIKLNDDITLENIEYSNEYVDDYDTYNECAWGSVEVEITAVNNKTGEVVKEVWVANGCKGSIEGLYVEKEHITADPYYSSPGSVEWDYIDWYDCNDGADWDKTISGPDDFWDDYQDDLEKVSDAIVEFIENGMKFKESCLSPKARFEEALTYKYRIVLDQPEGSNYRLTNSDKLKFKTKEDAQKRLDDMMKYMGDRLKSKGMGLKIEEIQPKERKKRDSYKDDPDFINPYEVGDILLADYGYSMTLPHFYEITKITPAGAVAKELESRVTDHDGYGQAGHKEPILGKYRKDRDGKDIEVKLKVRYPKFPRYYNQTREEYDEEMKNSNLKEICHLWGDRNLFSIWNGEPAVFDTYD